MTETNMKALVTCLLLVAPSPAEVLHQGGHALKDRDSSDCKTNGGAHVNQACVFPFRYKGIEYNKCTNAGHTEPWCATEVDSGENNIPGKWGNCGLNCPVGDCKTKGGLNCVFPFRYNDIEYNECTYAGHTEPWCVTKVDSEGNSIRGKWGNCGSDCPVRGRIPVPNNGACDWGLVKEGVISSCSECRKYYDPRSSYINGRDGDCVYVPSKSKCFPLKWANDHGMTVDDSCDKKGNMNWFMVAEKKECGGTEIPMGEECTTYGDRRQGQKCTSSIDECAAACSGISSMFIYGTTDFGNSRCDGLVKCRCYCETSAQDDGTCDMSEHTGYKLYKYGLCIDSDNGKTDTVGDGCEMYDGLLKQCGAYDTYDFRARELCCACKDHTGCFLQKGDTKSNTETTMPESANSAEECAEQVKRVHGQANGMTWDRYTSKCYAEFGATGLSDGCKDDCLFCLFSDRPAPEAPSTAPTSSPGCGEMVQGKYCPESYGDKSGEMELGNYYDSQEQGNGVHSVEECLYLCNKYGYAGCCEYQYDWKYCLFQPADIATGYNPTYTIRAASMCTAKACDDNEQNGDEEGVDCGGSKCDPCDFNLTGKWIQEATTTAKDYVFHCNSPSNGKYKCTATEPNGSTLENYFVVNGFSVVPDGAKQFVGTYDGIDTIRWLMSGIFYSNWQRGDVCIDIDNGKVDKDGDGCKWYDANAAQCGDWDDDDFRAEELCCSCKDAIYEKVAAGSLCSDKRSEVTTEVECKKAAERLGLIWGAAWNGPNDFPECFLAEDARNKVYFNLSPNPKRTNVDSKYAAICYKE